MKNALLNMTVKMKIWLTVSSVVLMFASFVLFYLPAVQGRYLLNNFNKEVQGHANTVALGVRIALTEQNFEGVQTAMYFVKEDPYLRFVSLIQIDTIRDAAAGKYRLKKTIFKTFPEGARPAIDVMSTDSIIVKRSAFRTPVMSGEILLGLTTDDIIASKKQIQITSLFFSLLVLGVGIVLGRWLARNISEPVLELHDAAMKVGDGDLTQRVKHRSRDEIGELGIAFNKMVGDLARARVELEERTHDLIDEKKKSDSLLEDLQKTLVDLKDTQDQLIRNEKLVLLGQLTKGIVDRTLNPLNYINNFSLLSKTLLAEANQSLESHRSVIDEEAYADVMGLLQLLNSNMDKINDHGTSAVRIVKGMEKLLKAKSGAFVHTDVNALVMDNLNLALAESKAEYGGFVPSVVTNFERTGLKVSVQPFELGSVIVHLTSNALFSMYEKYRQQPGYQPELGVETECVAGCFTIKLKDNGKGISSAEYRQLFSPFFTTKPVSKGTGLGLFISQDIIKTHKGSIAVDTREGEYTQFTITVPIQ